MAIPSDVKTKKKKRSKTNSDIGRETETGENNTKSDISKKRKKGH